MKKIPTLFKKDPNDLGRVINEIDPQNDWVKMHGVATVKFDGTACAIINGILYKRYDAKKGKIAPIGAIPCQEPDKETGHHPHWVICDPNKKEDAYFIEGLNSLTESKKWHGVEGTYELCGPKINGNKQGLASHKLLRHGYMIFTIPDRSYEGIKSFLQENNIEGIVFHHHDSVNDGRMCKIRRKDFGLKW